MRRKQIKSPVTRVIVLVFFVIVITLVAMRLRKEKGMRERVEERARELDAVAAQVSAEYQKTMEKTLRIGSDEYIEDVARESLGMVMPGETVYEPTEDD